MSKAYYNEFDRHAAAWLRELIKDGLIADGDVDERSIADVRPSDLNGYTQCHFFAGIGGWSHALRLAGWPDDQPVWTGSCPCQPFSVAGKSKGIADERHLWPELARLIGQCRPPIAFGEQVASKAGRAWLSLVQTDLEALGYRSAAADLCAAGVGAPHIRQRLWWVADCIGERRQLQSVRRPAEGIEGVFGSGELREQSGALGAGFGGVADTQSAESVWQRTQPSGKQGGFADVCGDGVALGDTIDSGLERHREPGTLNATQGRNTTDGHGAKAGVVNWPRTPHLGWTSPDWLYCRDHKWRPVEPGTFPLVNGLSRGVVPSGDPSQTSYANATSEARQMRLKGYGNAIVPQLAATFIEAYVEALND